MKHIIMARVDNKPGVVSRISGLFTRRGYNIESLVTGMTDDPSIYQLTVSLIGTQYELDLLVHQLGRIMEVIEVYTSEERQVVTRELMFIKIACPPARRIDIVKTASVLNMRIIGMNDSNVIVEVTGDEFCLETAAHAFEDMGIVEIVRSGSMALDI